MILFKIVVNEDKGRTNVQNGMTTWQRSGHATQTLHICGTMFLHHGDKIAVQISSNQLDKVIIKKPSSLSIVQIPEPVQYPSFVTKLEVRDERFHIFQNIFFFLILDVNFVLLYF